MPDRPGTIRVVAAVAVREGKVLVCRRPAGTHRAGRWEFPGGKVEAGESDGQALRRELMEELGVEAEISKLLDRHTHDYPDRRVAISFYAVRLAAGKLRAIGVDEARWIEPDETASLPFLEGDQRFLEKLRSPGRLEEWSA